MKLCIMFKKININTDHGFCTFEKFTSLRILIEENVKRCTRTHKKRYFHLINVLLFNFKLTVGFHSSVSYIFSHYILHCFLGDTIFLSHTWNRTLGIQTIKLREFLTALPFLDITWSYPRYIESFEVINRKKIFRLYFNIHCTYSNLIHFFFTSRSFLKTKIQI